MKQQTLSMAADRNEQYELHRKPTRRDTFLAKMEKLVPWDALCSVIEPHYPKAGNGRPPVDLECWRRPKTEPLLRVVPTQN